MRYLLAIIILLISIELSAQSEKRQKLEAQKVRLMDEIELANRILKETQTGRENSLGLIQTVQQKLRLRERLIRTLDKEIELLGEEEQETEAKVDTLRARIERQKESYAHMIRQAYKSRKNSSRLMFILSSSDFNQARRRIEYLKQYNAFRRQKVREIEKQQVLLNQELERLKVQKVRKQAVRGQLKQERERLGAEKLSQEEALATFKKTETELEQKLKKQLAEAARIEKQIEKIIAEEIAKARALAARKQLEDEAIDLGLVRGKDFSSNTTNERLEGLIADKRKALAAAGNAAAVRKPKYELSPEAQTLAANFEANQRSLPWPVERGLVTGKFGPQRHPVVKSVIIDNRGIDIATEKESAIRAVFDGEVSRVFRMPDGQLAIVINHGSYFSVYQGITDIQVSIGQKVSRMQALGNSYTNPITAETKLHFEIWKKDQAVNPLLWLSNRS